MSADTLRTAAAKMRERAEAAIHDSEGVRVWHSATPESVSAGPWEIADALAQPDAEHIASWDPAVALAVADLLEGVADSWADDPGCDLGGGYDFTPECESCFRCFHYETQMRALAVANAYLGT